MGYLGLPKKWSAVISCLVVASALVTPRFVFAGGVVSNNTDADLRAALVGGGTVTFAIDGTIVLTNTLVITNNTVLDGSGHSVTLSGGGAVRVLLVNSGANLTLRRLTIANGHAVSGLLNGGGLLNNGGATVVECTFSDNFVTGTSWGGAIFHSGTSLQITGSTFVQNNAGVSGGAISTGYLLGDLWNGNIVVTNCTFFANGGGVGGAVSIGEPLLNPVTLVNCTFAWNTNGSVRRSVSGFYPGAAGVRLINCVVADTVGASGVQGIVDLGHNLSTDGSFTNATSLVNANPLLGPLADNGGPTWTMALSNGSPALNQADFAAAPSTDQRGVVRPLGPAPDIGAYEGTAAAVPGVKFSSASYSVGEGASQAAIQIERTGSSTGSASVLFAATPGSASAQDFFPTNLTVSFGDGELSRTVYVSISNDTQVEPDETVLLTLSNPAGVILDLPSTATLTIQDDDQPHYVSTCDETGLRAAISNGTWVVFTCDGTITLSSPIAINASTILDAGGHDVVLSGNNAVRLFNVTSAGSLTLKDLTLVNGNAIGSAGGGGGDGSPAFGGAVFVDKGVLTLVGCRLWTNTAAGGAGGNGNPNGSGGSGYGGAIYLASGMLNVTNSEFKGNIVVAGPGGTNFSGGSSVGTGGNAWGGAVYAVSGLVNFDDCLFLSNQTMGGKPPGDQFGGGFAGMAAGGALYNDGGTTVVARCSFEFNRGTGFTGSTQFEFPGFSGCPVLGGAVYSSVGGSVTLVESLFASNSAVGGDASYRLRPAGDGQGGAVFGLGPVTVTRCIFSANAAVGGNSGSQGTDAQGGALFCGGTSRISDSWFVNNTTSGGDARDYGRGHGKGGAIANSNSLSLINCTFSKNSAQGVSGGSGNFGPHPGSEAFGGAIYNAGTCNLTNNTLGANVASGGACVLPSPPPFTNVIYTGGGNAFGGAIFNTNGTLILVNNTLSGNAAVGGSGFPDGTGYGGGIANASGLAGMINTIVANSLSGSNSFGSLTDLGHNISSDASCSFSAPGSLNNIDPVLGPLDDFGGATPTMPLLAGSPAIDAGDNANFPPTDQRGHARPYGSSPDIGAFESSPPYVIHGAVSGSTLTEEVLIAASSGNVSSTNHGSYRLEGLAANTYLVTPSSPNYLFLPNNRTITVGPDHLGVDFKAYHWNALSLDGVTNNVMHLVFAGTNGQTYRLLASTNLLQWFPVATNTIGASNYYERFISMTNNGAQFFRTVNP